MKTQALRQWFLPALLAAAIAPLSLSAIAAPGDGNRQGASDTYQQRQMEQRQALFERAGIDKQTRQAMEDARREHRKATRQMRQEHRQRMNQLLDDDQRQALSDARQEMRQERRAERRQFMQQRMDERFDALGLSEEERQALSDIRSSFYADMQELRDRNFDSRSERREAWNDLRQEHYDAMADILSEEQMQELRDGMRDRRGSRGHHGKWHSGGGYQGDCWGDNR